MEVPKTQFALSRRLTAAEELPISSWWSQVTSHKELGEIVQYEIWASIKIHFLMGFQL